MLGRWPVLPFEATFGHCQHTQAIGRQRIDRRGDARLRCGVEVTQLDHGFGRTLGGHHLRAARWRCPHMRHRAQPRAQRVGLHQPPVAVQVLGLG